MKKDSALTVSAARLLGGVAISAVMTGAAAAQSISDTIVVTSQRTEQSLQDVPISVSAFGGEDLQARQLESFQDIQFNIPNFAFSRTQFTGSAVGIRGVGNFVVASSSESAVSVHMNDFFLDAPRLFETEFFDIERLEILRGPQGTLFGRNATAGVINVITAKANPDEVEAYADAEYGNYNAVKVHGALNVPVSETFALRVAGTVIQRDGYMENVFTGRDIDDRDIYAVRGSARWYPTDDTTLDIVASYMQEDDNRSRHQKQACEAGPLQPVLGCDPNGPRAFDVQDQRATFLVNNSAEAFGALFAPAAAAFGLYSLGANPVGEPQPESLRQVAWDTDPEYYADETIFMANLRHDFDSFTVKITGGYGESDIATRTDFDGGVGPEFTVPAALFAPASLGGLPGVAALYSDGLFPISEFDVGVGGLPDGRVGVIGGRIQDRTSRYRATDFSIGDTEYWSVEGIINTSFDGPLNFLLGVNHLESDGFANYGVATSGLDYFSLVGGTLAAVGAAQVQGCAVTLAGGGTPTAMQVDACTNDFGSQPAPAQMAGGAAAAAAATQGFSFYSPYFYNDSRDTFLDSTSVFAELYYDITDTLKLTGGVRRNWDTKGVKDRLNFLDTFIGSALGTLPPGAPPVVPIGTQSVLDLLDSDPNTQGTAGAVQDFRVIESGFNSLTGRAVLQWTPSDNAQYYASWTRGFKPGGFNPRAQTAGGDFTFEPEVINAFEVGVKSSLFDDVLQMNLAAFYYDYSGLQVSRIANNTSFNENIDATIWGLEGEFVLRPTDELTINMNASYLNTELGEFASVDVRNPGAGRTDVEVIGDIALAQNCVITRGAGDAPLIGQTLGGPFAGLNPLIASPFSVCSQLASNIDSINLATGGSYAITGGIEQSVEGNRLLGAPEFKIAGGIQYDFYVNADHVLTPRVDAYYQTNFYVDNFNTQQDLVDGYGYINAQLRYGPTDGAWHVRFFMQNVTDSDAITGSFNSGETAGNFQNLFLLEPRRYGVGLGLRF